MIDLTGRMALITGGSRGIGWACVECFLRAGAHCAFTYRTGRVAAREAQRSLGAEAERCIAVPLDLEDPESVAAAVDKVRTELGRIDILVNNAGVWNVEPRPLEALDDAEVRRMLAVNVAGAVQVTRHAVADMRRRDWGRVITIGSTAAIRGEPGHGHYAASKGAILSWTRSLVGELAPHGITANVVSPGWVYTDMTSPVLEPARVQEIEARIPTRRLTRPDDVAAAVAFLASPLAGQITGANLDVNGGVFYAGD